jgi:hypothetical protein
MPLICSLHDECHGTVVPENVILLQLVKQFSVVTQLEYKQKLNQCLSKHN